MKHLSAFRRRKSDGVLLLGAALLVLGYNLWAYCCGHCRLADFIRFGPVEWLLAGVVAALALLRLRQRRATRARLQRSHCRCGQALAAAWSFCPGCGADCA